MARLEDVSADDLRSGLEEFEEARQMRRLVAALLYKCGPSAPTIAEWLDVRVATVYAWLDRFEETDSVTEAVSDRSRPGRPPRLDFAQRHEFFEVLNGPPGEADLKDDAWTPRLARDYLVETYGVEYSLRHVRRLFEEADRRNRSLPTGRRRNGR